MPGPRTEVSSSAIDLANKVESEPLLLAEMREVLTRVHGLPAADAAACIAAFGAVAAAVEPEEVVDVVRALRRTKRQARDARIKAQLRTGNAAQLAKAEGLSVSRVYEIAGVRPGQPEVGGPAGEGERLA
jgi:hypothetical protein